MLADRRVHVAGVEVLEAIPAEVLKEPFLAVFTRIGDTAGPERIPDAVNLTANFTSKHRGSEFQKSPDQTGRRVARRPGLVREHRIAGEELELSHTR